MSDGFRCEAVERPRRGHYVQNVIIPNSTSRPTATATLLTAIACMEEADERLNPCHANGGHRGPLACPPAPQGPGRRALRQSLLEVESSITAATEGRDPTSRSPLCCTTWSRIRTSRSDRSSANTARRSQVSWEEVTDDRSLPKAERKRLQAESAGQKPGSEAIKLADKTSNRERSPIARHPIGRSNGGWSMCDGHARSRHTSEYVTVAGRTIDEAANQAEQSATKS